MQILILLFEICFSLLAFSEIRPETVGFEVEYVGDLNASLYPFLQAEISSEVSGNNEVRSKVFSNNMEALQSLQFLVNRLGDKRRSIHIHRRIPKGSSPLEAINGNALASRLSDIVFLWRLAKAPKIATTYYSQERRSPLGASTTKGTVFLQDFGKEWDFETRGVFDDPIYAMHISKTFSHELSRERDLSALYYVQSGLHLRTESLFEALEKERLRKGESPLLEFQKNAVDFLERSVRYSALLPLFHYEQMPNLSNAEKKSIKEAHQYFLTQSLKLVRTRTPLDTDFSKRFRDLLSQWAQKSNLEKILGRHLTRQEVSRSSVKTAKDFLKARIFESNQSVDARVRSEADAVYTQRGLSKWMEEKISNELTKTSPNTATFLGIMASEGPEWEGLVEKMLKHPVKEVRVEGINLLWSRTPYKVPLNLIQDAIERENDSEVRSKLLDLVMILMRKGLTLNLGPGRSEHVQLPIVGQSPRPRGRANCVLNLQRLFENRGPLILF